MVHGVDGDPSRADPDMATEFIKQAYVNVLLQREALPQVMAIQDQAVPPNGTVVPTWPVCLANPRVLHDEIPFDVSTVFVSEILETSELPDLFATLEDEPDLLALIEQLLPRARGVQLLLGDANVRPHTDAKDAWQIWLLYDHIGEIQFSPADLGTDK